MFVLTLPVSLPIWIGLVLIAFLMLSVLSAIKPLRAFWSDPPTQRRSYHYYGSHRIRKEGEASDVEDASDVERALWVHRQENVASLRRSR